MTDNQDSKSQASEPMQSGGAAEKKTIRVRRLMILLLTCLIIGVGVQFIFGINDNSVRNTISMIAAVIGYLGTTVWVYRTFSVHLSRLKACVIAMMMLLTPLSLFRLTGFTGAFVPQFEFRFASSERKLDSRPIEGDSLQFDHTATSDFPQFLGPHRDGVIPQREFELPLDSPMKPLWQNEIGDGWSGFAVSGSRCVTLEQRGDQECVTCYRLADGALLWIHQESARHESTLGGIGPRSTPTIHQERVYAQGATGILLCLDLVTGEPIWRHELLELAGWSQAESEVAIAWGRSGSPLLIDEQCIVPFGGPSSLVESPGGDNGAIRGRGLIAFDALSGDILWATGKDQISYASAIEMTLAGTPQLVIVNEKTVSGHAIESGDLLWSTPWRGQSNAGANCASAIQVDERAFLVGKAYGTGSAVFEIESGEQGFRATERWVRPSLLKTKLTHACMLNGHAYGLSDGMLECVDVADGRRKWSQPRGARYGHGQLLIVGDVLVVQTEPGDIAFVAARDDRFEELLRLPALNSKTWNIPAVAGQYLLIRNDTRAICYALPAKEITRPASIH